MNRVTVGGLACALALLFAAACSSTGGNLPTNGPFGNGGSYSGTFNTCARPGQVVHDGFDEFPNTGGTATISRVALVDPRHLRLLAAWVLPITGSQGVDVGWGYPSASSVASVAPGTRWELRQRIPGAVVRHTRGREMIDLVIVVKPFGKVASTKGFDLYYEAAGTRYLLRLPIGLNIPVRRTCTEK